MKLNDQLCLRSRTLHGIARPAQELQVVHVIGPAVALRGDVIHGEIAELERNLASRAMPFLLSEKQVFVCPVAGQFAKSSVLECRIGESA